MPEALFWDTNEPYHYLRVDRRRGFDYAIFGGEDHKTGQESNTEAPYARLKSKLREWIPQAKIDHRWSGQVVETNDGVPFIGETAESQFVATGFSGNGMTFGTLSGMMAVDLSMSILIVDDYNTMIRIIRNLLRQLGFEDVDDAPDGAAALAKMRSKRYGLVISDWNMEPMTGYDLLKEVRADPALGKTPFIMVTAESKTENVIAAKQAGVSNYIVKPFNAETLKTKIESVFASA